ncbi:EAL domain-containing protein [Pseudoduganella sp. GCM10020061]|uniref:EAL domain-containing protein n=1 Tax=Pseudoduganella sp. GCM10020061 TaxID=3317345 RepID=UPI003636DDF8
MNKSAAFALTLVVATLAIGVPIWFAVEESRQQGLRVETERVQTYARDVLYRSDSTADQISRAILKLRGLSGRAPCSDAGIAMMREVDLASSYIQAFGHVVGDQLMCSSLGTPDEPWLLGPADIRTPAGASIRANVRFPFAPNSSFIVIEQQGFAGVIHKDLPIDTTTNEKDVALAIFSLFRPIPLSARGTIDPGWISRLQGRADITFSDGDHIVAIVRSRRYQTAALAAIPISYAEARTVEAAKRLVPIGLIAGIVLTLAILQLARSQLALPAAIKAGLKRDEFYLVYQPIVELGSGRCVGAEALMRWLRPAGEVVGPDLFIPIAEQTGLVRRLTARVLHLAAADLGDIFSRHPGFHVAVNLSQADLHSAETPGMLADFLIRTKAGPCNLIIEATERGFLEVNVAREIMAAIRAQGIGIAIDDFGTGYSSLSYLQTFDLDYLKIDKSFVEAIGTESPTSHVIEHIIEMAKSLRLDMIAEGVETEAQAQYLRERGVQYAQGWLFGRPAPFFDITRLLE